MGDIWLYVLLVLTIISNIILLIVLIRSIRGKRDIYNTEYPQDFVEPSSNADDDMRDRFMGANWK